MQTSTPDLIRALQDPGIYPHETGKIELVETHISWVILTGHYAYKIKKPVNFGFLDFSTLEKRQFYCQEELRLNQRLAPQVYLGVVAVCGSQDQPVLDGQGQPIEYAVRMKQFAADAQLDTLLAAGKLSVDTVDEIADVMAAFHNSIEVAGDDTNYGSIEAVNEPVMENFHQIRQQQVGHQERMLLDELQSWSEQFLSQHQQYFIDRKQQGFVRECHGDMHLRNIALIDGRIVMFDCLEFNDTFRWIDVMSEVAFLCMDLEDREQLAWSQRLLNRYLEITGDYAGMRVFRFYKVYRAMVRAKVDVLRLSQPGLDQAERESIYREFCSYLQLALRYTLPETQVLYITHGLSGSGKTTGTDLFMQERDVIRVRSDVERKRLFGMQATQRRVPGREGEMYQSGIYSKQASIATYDYLFELTGILLEAGFSVIVDACFLQYEERQRFHELAERKGLSYMVLSFAAPYEKLRQRVLKRQQRDDDASDAGLDVLQHQMEADYELHDTEKDFTLVINQGGVKGKAGQFGGHA